MAAVPAKTLDEIVTLANKSAISLVRFLYCDTSSIIRGKATRTERLKDRLESGIGLVKGMMAMNMLDQMQTDTGLNATGEVRLIPDPETWVVLPYAERSAAMICDLIQLDHTPWSLCPRSLLKRQIEKAKDMGVSFQVAFEPEFTLGTLDNDQFVAIDRSLCFSSEGMNRASKFINRFIDCLERQNIEVEQYYPELGHGQHELSIRHTNALRACDRHIQYRETLRGVAYELSMEAYMAPKPFNNQAGNGCHLHLSAWDIYGERNLFWAENGLSEFGRYFVAGLLEHLPGLVALTCSSVNSYRRLKPKSWSSAFTCWGFENREAAIRIPSTYWGQEMASCNIEIKCVDSSCNPYLALGAVIACGLDGVKRQLPLPPPVEADPSTLSEDEKATMKIHRLPTNLHEAVIEMEEDKLLMDILGEEFARAFINVKVSEAGAFAGANEEFELAQHRNKF
ncbi:MAG TPA: glutamine synthetase family protein [Planktothrix sp.]|jgi:glutamine synthetase